MMSIPPDSKVEASTKESHSSGCSESIRKRFRPRRNNPDAENSSLRDIEQNENDDSQEILGSHESKDIKKNNKNEKDIHKSKCCDTLIMLANKVINSIYFKVVFTTLVIMCMNYFYIESNTSCPTQPYNLVICVEWLRKEGFTIFIEGVLSSLCYSTILLLVFKRYIPWYCLIISTINVLVLYQQKLGGDLINHGSVNRLFHCIFIIGNVSTYWIVKLAIWIWRKSKIAILIIISSGFFMLVLFYFVRVKDSCSGWEYGLHNAKLENGDGLCYVPIPHYCELKIREGMFDINRFARKCANFPMKFDKSMINNLKTSKADIKRVGFPRIEQMPNDAKIQGKMLRRYLKNNIVDMDDPSVSQSIKDNIEYVVDITESDSDRLTIDVKRNETRCNELKEIKQKVLEEDKSSGTQRIDKNVLVLFFDNLSRVSFHRKLKKVVKFLNEILEGDDSEYDAFEYFRYHSVAMNTFMNKNGMFYGTAGLLKSESSNFYKYYSQNGYVTGYFLDQCQDVDNLWEDENKKMDPFYSFDHTGTIIACDYNYDGVEKELTFGIGINDPFDRCLYGKTLFEIQTEYLSQFWKKYSDLPKLFMLLTNYPHESTGELITYLDEPLEKFLREFYNQGNLKNTELLIVADHGTHFITSHSPFFPDDSRHEENMLGVLIYITHKDSPIERLKFLKDNQQQFTTVYDVYGTLKALAVGKPTETGHPRYYAIQYEALPKGRDCTDGDGIHYFQCWCRNDVSKIDELKAEHWYFYLQF